SEPGPDPRPVPASGGRGGARDRAGPGLARDRAGADGHRGDGRVSVNREGDRMAPDDLTLAAGARLLHIGPHKTGTTAIQGAFHLARGQLAAHGVVDAGADRAPVRATLAVPGRPALLAEAPPDMALSDNVV